MQNENILSQIKKTEQKFKENNYKGNSSKSCLVEKFGNIPILLSAPHAVKQIRNGEIKHTSFIPVQLSNVWQNKSVARV